MMIRLSILLFFLTVGPLAFAQTLLIGPKVGVQAVRPSFDEYSPNAAYKGQYALAPQIGLVSNIKVSEFFSLHTELLYEQRVRKISDNDLLTVERYHYVSAPAMLRISHRVGGVSYYVNGGPRLGYWLGGRGFEESAEIGDEVVERQNYKIVFEGDIDRPVRTDEKFVPEPNRWQLGLDVGAGALLPVGETHIMVDVRYSWGHTHMARSPELYAGSVSNNSTLEHSHNMIGVSVAYLFELDFLEMRRGKSRSPETKKNSKIKKQGAKMKKQTKRKN